MQRMIDMANRMGVGRRAKAFDLVEGQIRPGRDDQIVISDRCAVVQLDTLFVRVQALGALRIQRDVALFHHRFKIDLDRILGAPADGDPGIGRDERIFAAIGNDGNLWPLPTASATS